MEQLLNSREHRGNLVGPTPSLSGAETEQDGVKQAGWPAYCEDRSEALSLVANTQLLLQFTLYRPWSALEKMSFTVSFQNVKGEGTGEG